MGLPRKQADFIGRAQEGGSLLPVNSNGCRRTRRGQAVGRRVLPNLQQNNYRVTYCAMRESRSTKQPLRQPTNQLGNHSASQLTTQPTSQPANLPSNKLTGDPPKNDAPTSYTYVHQGGPCAGPTWVISLLASSSAFSTSSKNVRIFLRTQKNTNKEG